MSRWLFCVFVRGLCMFQAREIEKRGCWCVGSKSAPSSNVTIGMQQVIKPSVPCTILKRHNSAFGHKSIHHSHRVPVLACFETFRSLLPRGLIWDLSCIFVACELQTYFWSSLLSHQKYLIFNIYLSENFARREATTGNTSALARLASS